MNFEFALQELKCGRKVTRWGWNAPNQFVYMVPANSYPAQTEAARQTFGSMVPYQAYFALVTAQRDVATWVPSSSDLLAEDWGTV